MLAKDPVKIPDIPGKISFVTIDGKEYVRYLAGRKYNADRKYTEPERIVIGRRAENMPEMMYPNDNYEQIFSDREQESMEETMTPEEQDFIRNHRTYETYSSFFDALYNELKQQTRRRTDDPINVYKAEKLNKVLRPLLDMMKDEEYAGLLGLIECSEEGGEYGMTYGDAMFLMTQYKNALTKYRRKYL